MARPHSFLAGSAVGALVAGLFAAAVPTGHADETRKDVRLLVSCDEGTRPMLLEALRPLPVAVYDLATMERIALEDQAPIRDAIEVLKAVNQAVGDAREKGPKEATLTVLRISVTNRETHLAVRVSAMAVLDAIQESLQKSPTLGAANLRREPIQRDASGAFESAFRFEAAPPAAGRTAEAPRQRVAAFPHAAILDAIQRAGGQINTLSAEHRVGSPAGGGASSSVLDCEISAVGNVQAALENLAAIPGVRVTAVSWRLIPNARDHVRATIEVTADLQR